MAEGREGGMCPCASRRRLAPCSRDEAAPWDCVAVLPGTCIPGLEAGTWLCFNTQAAEVLSRCMGPQRWCISKPGLNIFNYPAFRDFYKQTSDKPPLLLLPRPVQKVFRSAAKANNLGLET